MNAEKHTPGPWMCFEQSGGFSIESPGLHPVACINWLMAKRDCAKANARLIAAAPELLEAGELMMAFYDDLAKSNPGFLRKLSLQDYSRWNQALLKLPAAIAKAKGELTNE